MAGGTRTVDLSPAKTTTTGKKDFRAPSQVSEIRPENFEQMKHLLSVSSFIQSALSLSSNSLWHWAMARSPCFQVSPMGCPGWIVVARKITAFPLLYSPRLPASHPHQLSSRDEIQLWAEPTMKTQITKIRTRGRDTMGPGGKEVMGMLMALVTSWAPCTHPHSSTHVN